MFARAEKRAAIVYGALDRHAEVFEPHADESSRSSTNVTFRLADDDLGGELMEMAAQERLTGLGGHRSVGGFRASMYTGMPVEAAQRLADVLERFAERCGRAGG